MLYYFITITTSHPILNFMAYNYHNLLFIITVSALLMV